MTYTILRIPEVSTKTGLSRSTIYAMLDPQDPKKRYDPTFPKPITLGKRAVGFVSSEVDSWIEQKIFESRQVKAA